MRAPQIYYLFFKDRIKFLPTNITPGCTEDLIRALHLKHDTDNSFRFGRPCLRYEKPLIHSGHQAHSFSILASIRQFIEL